MLWAGGCCYGQALASGKTWVLLWPGFAQWQDLGRLARLEAACMPTGREVS